MLSLLAVVSANAQLTINVAVGDHAGVNNPTTTNLTEAVIDNARAGIEEWTQHLLLAGPRTLDVHVRFDGPPGTRGSGRSLTTSFVRHEGGLNIYEQAAAAYLRTGLGSRAVEFVFEPAYLENQIWFDPDPFARTIPVPDNRIDSVTFFAHEFGHVLAFNGWYDTATGALPGDYVSTYDHYSRLSNGQWFFHGPQTTNLWGAPLPLSYINNNYHHYGNPPESNAPGSDAVLVDGLMNGVRFLWGRRYRVNLLDLAIARDCGGALSAHHTFAGPGRVSIEPPTDGIPRLIWESIPLGNYAVEYRDALTDSWRTLGSTNILTSPPGTVRIEDLSPVLPWQRYYRVRLHP